MIVHPIPPVFDKISEILILGSFPSVKSRETAFFYGHPQNRFWLVLSSLLNCGLPKNTEEKCDMLLSHHIALWDVIQSCEITGSSDASITNVVPNDLGIILKPTRIKAIYTNGATADKLYRKYCLGRTGIEAVRLPSTSPANAAFSLERLTKYWSILLQNTNTCQ